MKVIYKLPKYVAIGLACLTIFLIWHDINKAKTATFFDMIAGENTSTIPSSILGISLYWILMFIGLFITIILAYLRRNIYGIKGWVSIVVAIVFFLQAFLGAKLLFGIEMAFNQNSIKSFDISGQSLYGTVFISFAFIPILALILKKRAVELYDYIAPFWLVLLVFVRTGCYFNGCCGADACSILGAEIILPVQLFEVVIDLLILQIVFNIEKETHVSKTNKQITGNSFFIMIGIYGVFRFILEFLRNNSIIWLGMTFGQIYSVLCVIIAIIIIRKRVNKVHESNI